MQSEDDHMLMDDGAQTQQQTQSTQQASQGEVQDERCVWGYLIPCSPNLRRIDFQKSKPIYRVGRNREEHKNDVILPGMKISNFHCTIEWDKDESHKSAVTVMDLSSNGTFINGEKIGKGKHQVLRDGNELAFGTCTAQAAGNGFEDYRFVFRHIPCGPPTRGLHKYYDLQHELGKGSFATVMKALHREEGKWYAVKMIQANKLRKGLSHISMNAQAKANDKTNNFAREINILERLRHRNICQLKEVFFESYNINLVLEWVNGGDLLDYILKKRDGMQEPEAQYLTYQICDALAYVHGQGIAHRDLKPENVLLTNDHPPVVKVADFGLAKAIDSMTMLRTMCGTPVYLAPEVVSEERGDEGYDQVVDSWSVGVIVFSMLTMSTPFGEEDPSESVASRVKNRRVKWHILHESRVSPAGEDFIRRLLEYDPRKRMTLTNARNHPWLRVERSRQPQPQPAAALPAPARPIAPNAAPLQIEDVPRPRTVSPVPEESIDLSMRSIMSDGMALDEGEPMDAEPSQAEEVNGDGRRTPEYIPPPVHDRQEPSQGQSQSQRANGIARQGSRLVRRGDVIQRAHERGEVLPGPSQEMQLRAAAEEEEEDENEAGPSRVNKRKVGLDFEGSLTPMPEDYESERRDDEDDDGEDEEPARTPVNGRGRGAPAGKRGRGAAAAKKASVPPPAKRGRGRASVSVNGHANGNGVVEDAGTGRPRRSTRLHQNSPAKVARRG